MWWESVQAGEHGPCTHGHWLVPHGHTRPPASEPGLCFIRAVLRGLTSLSEFGGREAALGPRLVCLVFSPVLHPGGSPLWSAHHAHTLRLQEMDLAAAATLPGVFTVPAHRHCTLDQTQTGLDFRL